MIIKVIDSQGTTMNKYAYSPFGELLVEQEQVTLNIGFNTKYEDESGLTYYNNRYYSHSLDRFISQDPIFEEGGVNLYSFTVNDPLNHWDILGEASVSYGNLTLNGDVSFSNLDYIDVTSAFKIGILGVVIAHVNFEVDITGTVGITCSGVHKGKKLSSSGTFTGTVINYNVSVPISIKYYGTAIPAIAVIQKIYKVSQIIKLGNGAASAISTYIDNAALILEGAKKACKIKLNL